MRMLEAMEKTLALAAERGFEDTIFEQAGVDFEHLYSMYARVREYPGDFSEGKLGRWLGYIQGVLVATETITLEEAKDLNRQFAD